MMQSLPSIYRNTLSLSQDAFSQGAFFVAYHTLVASIHCAIELDSLTMLTATQASAEGQLRASQTYYQEHPPLEEPTEMALYTNLIAMLDTKLATWSQPK